MKKHLTGLLVITLCSLTLPAQIHWLDHTFAHVGIYTEDSFYAQQLVVQPDAKIMIGGLGNIPSFCLNRLNADGSVDTTFGQHGFTSDSSLYNPYLYWGSVDAMAQRNGKTLLAGFLGTEDAALEGEPYVSMIRQYNADGTKDTSFGTNGNIINVFGSLWPVSTSHLLIGTDGRIYLVGCTYYDSGVLFYSYPSSTYRVICYDSLGRIDSTYGVNGKVFIPYQYLGYIGAAAIQPDQKILIAGSDSSGTVFSMLRFTTSGILDSTFGINGIATISCDSDFGNFDALYVQSDGKILGTKYESQATLSNYTEFKMSRFTANGMIDASFGEAGCAGVSVPSGLPTARIMTGYASAASEYANGDMLISGIAVRDTLDANNVVRQCPVIGFVRCHADGSVDSTFGENGILTTDPITYDEYDPPSVSNLILLSDGQFLASGGGTELFKFLGAADNTGVKEINESSLSLYPNPVEGKLYIRTDLTGLATSLSDMTGQSWPVSISKNEMDISALPVGVYCLQFQNEDGVAVRKFVKK